MAACVPAMRPIYISVFRSQAPSAYNPYAPNKNSYMLHSSSNGRARSSNAKRAGAEPDARWKGVDGDGEGLVIGDGISQTVHLDVIYEGAVRDGANQKTQRRSEEGW